MVIDLGRLGPAILVDDDGHVVETNAGGREWLGPGGEVPPAWLAEERGADGAAKPARWIVRSLADGSTASALLTVVPQAPGSLLLIAESPARRAVADSHLRNVLDSLPAMIGYWDRDLRNRFANTAYVAWFASTPEQLYGRHIRDLLGPELFAKNWPYMQGALRGEIQHFERAIPRPDGQGVRHSNASYVPEIVDGEVLGFSVLVTDVSELKAAQNALQVAGAELERRVQERTHALEQSNRELARANAELVHFARVVSHDLQEPIRQVGNYGELLGERYRGQLDERADRYLGYVCEGAARLQKLVAGLMELSKVGGSQRPLLPILPEHQARAALAGLRLSIDESGATVTIEPMPLVSGDAQEIVEVFHNLIGNALKFRGPEPPRITVAASDLGELVEIAVTDNGIGVDPAHAGKIFQMFYRQHPQSVRDGTGIGLAVTKKIVERHGGTVGVRSTPGRGATFWFTLRKAAAPP